MTGKTAQHTRNIWQETRTVVVATKAQPKRSAHTDQSWPTTQAEREADRWVAQMMFDHYNG